MIRNKWVTSIINPNWITYFTDIEDNNLVLAFRICRTGFIREELLTFTDPIYFTDCNKIVSNEELIQKFGISKSVNKLIIKKLFKDGIKSFI